MHAQRPFWLRKRFLAVAIILALVVNARWRRFMRARRETQTLKSADAFEKLAADLGEMDAGKRERAAINLGKLGDRRAVPALMLALDDDRREVAMAAIYGLAKLKAHAAVPKVLPHLKKNGFFSKKLTPCVANEVALSDATFHGLVCWALAEICNQEDTVVIDALKAVDSPASRQALQKIRLKPFAAAEAAAAGLEAACDLLAAELSPPLAARGDVRLATYGFVVKGSQGRTYLGEMIGANIEIAIHRLLKGRITLIERSQLAAAVKEQSLQASAAFDETKQIKLGQLLGANIILAGEVFPQPKAFMVAASLVEVETGKTLAKASTNITRNKGLDALLKPSK